MDQTQIDEFLAERRNATLATVNQASAPVQVPVFFDWHEGHAYVSVTTQRGFFPEPAHESAGLALCRRCRPPSEDGDHPGRGEGRGGGGHWNHTGRIIRKYVPEDQVETTLERMHKEPRVILDVTPTMITSWSPTPADREVWRST